MQQSAQSSSHFFPRASVVVLFAISACDSTPRGVTTNIAKGEATTATANTSIENPTTAKTSTGASDGRVSSSALVALVDGKSLHFSQIRADLIESSGQQAMRDAIVDTRLAERLATANLSIGPTEIDRERALLVKSLSDNPARAEELLAAIRLRQGLGEVRFQSLLRRNAALRALVAREVKVDEVGVSNAFDMLHGPKRVARLAVLGSLAEAEAFAREVQAGRDFSELAVERSLDDGAARGGLLPPIARRDPSYPEPLRAAMYATSIGSVSPPILDGPRFYVVKVLREIPQDAVTIDAARARCEEAVRLARERLLMDALARELASLEGVTIFDRAFDPPAR
jgi:parvulin-like peptidyl-prolyl isomerase